MHVAALATRAAGSWRPPRSARGLLAQRYAFSALLLTVLASLLSACQSAPRVGQSGRTDVWILDDGMHVGILMRAADLPLDRFSAKGTAFADARYIEFGFSELRWAMGDPAIIGDILMRPHGTYEGVVIVQPHFSLADAAEGRKAERRIMTGQDVVRVTESIGEWLCRPLSAELSPLRPNLWVLRSSHPYTLFCNCRYFVDVHLSAAAKV